MQSPLPVHHLFLVSSSPAFIRASKYETSPRPKLRGPLVFDWPLMFHAADPWTTPTGVAHDLPDTHPRPKPADPHRRSGQPADTRFGQLAYMSVREKMSDSASKKGWERCRDAFFRCESRPRIRPHPGWG